MAYSTSIFAAPSAYCTSRQNTSCQAIFEDSPSCATELQPPSQSSPGDLLSPRGPCLMFGEGVPSQLFQSAMLKASSPQI